MPNINFLMNKTVNVKRRANWNGVAPRDAYNAPNYGDSDTWDTIYTNMPCRIEVRPGKGAPISFTKTGERVQPKAIMFVDVDYQLQAEDRIYDGNLIWICEGVEIFYNTVGGIHHYEFFLIVN